MTEPLPTGQLEHVNPKDLFLELNVRTEATVTKQFVASVKENGVLVPIVAVRTAEGDLYVRAGQRRTLAAREAGLPTVPVYVIAELDAAESDAATRLVQQITENDQRLSLPGSDRVRGIQALLDTGLSIAKVSKRLAVSPERVKQSKAVAGSQVAMDALTEQTVTLAEAAGLAEFADDEDAVTRLLQAAGRNYFDHELERLRRVKAEDAAREVAAREWIKLGYTVIDEYPAYGSNLVPLHQLLDANGVEATEADVKDPTQWSIMLTEVESFTDADGNEVDESTIDWSTEDDPTRVAAEGMVHVSRVVESTGWAVQAWFCHDPETAGLTASERWSKLNAAAASVPAGGTLVVSEDLAAKAAQSAERRRVIALNKAAEAAESVRRSWLKALLKRKTPPEGAMVFMADLLCHNGSLLGSYGGDQAAGDLLGDSIRGGELLDHVNDKRAEVVMLGLALGAMESQTPKSAWRGPGEMTKKYLRWLHANGYQLAPVERVMVGDLSAEKCMEELS